MKELLKRDEFSFIKKANKDFIIAFDAQMDVLGYTFDGSIVPGYCWGKYMIIYTKTGVKSRKSYARIYIRDEDIILRLYFSNVDKYREAIESAPDFIQEAFTGNFPLCNHCQGKTECIHQKRYTIHEKQYEVCDGRAFWFFKPELFQLTEYMKLFTAFYPQGRAK